jgi:uncharacterized protein (DUF302 family)
MDQFMPTQRLRPTFEIGTWIGAVRSARQMGWILAAALLICFSTAATADGNLVVKKSQRSVSETLDRLAAVLKARGISVVARVDHAAGAAKSGMSLRPTALLIFGNPKLGTPLMQANQKAGLDLPMKVLAWQDEGGQVWLAYAMPERLKADHGLQGQDAMLQQMAKALNSLTDEAIRQK